MKFDYWLGVGGNEPYMALYTAVADIKLFQPLTVMVVG